jgi:hypothetical protein
VPDDAEVKGEQGKAGTRIHVLAHPFSIRTCFNKPFFGMSTNNFPLENEWQVSMFFFFGMTFSHYF